MKQRTSTAAEGRPFERRVRRPVAHKQVYRSGPFGGTLNRTLCGRVAAGNDMNVAEAGAEVTCALCLRLIRQKTPNV